MDNVDDPLAEAKRILDDLENDLEKQKTFCKQIEDGNWEKKRAQSWLHGATDVWECNELARWLTDYPPSTSIANSSAKEKYDAWRGHLNISGPVRSEKVVDYDKKSRDYVERESLKPSGAFYAEHDKFEVQEPLLGETLYDFIARLARSFEDQHNEDQKRERKERKLGDWLEERALKSFLNFIRKQYPSEQVAFVEHIFPAEMELHYGRIMRLISPEEYPVPEKVAAEILIELARRCRNGRPDARHTAIESLALSWLCIACSRIRLPKTLESVRSIQLEAVLSGVEFGVSKNRTFGHTEFWRPLADDDFSVLLVPTSFGDQPLKISNRIATFLKIVARIPSKMPRTTIFQKSRKSLDRMFNLALQAVAPDPEFGNITYLSLLANQPHIHGDHRPRLKY
jgi:hypothetical protein